MGKVCFVFVMPRSAFGGIYGANAGAGTAVDASVGVNLVDIAGGDGSVRAFINASAACRAIFSDFVSHGIKV